MYNRVRNDMKVCGRCSLELPVSSFTSNGVKPSGIPAYRSECKECRVRTRVVTAADRQTTKARNRRKYQADPQKAMSEATARRRAKPEHYRAYMREFQKEQRRKDPERWREKGRREQLQRRVGRDAASYEYALILLRDPCSYCGGPADTMDHIEPLVRGGDSSWENLTAACKRCNGTKRHTRLLPFLLGHLANRWHWREEAEAI